MNWCNDTFKEIQELYLKDEPKKYLIVALYNRTYNKLHCSHHHVILIIRHNTEMPKLSNTLTYFATYAFVDIFGTRARIPIDFVDTCAKVLTRTARTLVDILNRRHISNISNITKSDINNQCLC